MASREDLAGILEKARAFLELLKSEHIAVDSAYLFGSYAKGSAREDSDIDIAVISERWLPDIIDARYQLMKLASTIDSRIETHPIEKESLSNGDPFVKEILSSGTRL
jgi:predicted nucleotidyltransferase